MNVRRLALALVLTLLASSGSIFAQISATNAENYSGNLWLVEFNNAPTADGTSSAAVQKDKTDFRSAASRSDITYVERKSFGTLWNGLSVRASRSAAAAMAQLPGVKAVYPDLAVSYDPRQADNQTDLVTAIKMTGADVVQSVLHFTGRGVKVAVIDTGIDYNHPDLGGGFGAGFRVEKGYDFVGDLYDSSGAPTAANPHPNDPVPDPDPMDCAGHGTHVAGIIGANGDPAAGHVRGVAPGVTLYAYRVFGCTGTTDSSVMIDAMERAFIDGAQVVNMSIGASRQWPQYPTASASDRLVKRGVVVVASIGNDGAIGIYGASAPGVGEKVIGVASFDNTNLNVSTFTISPDAAHVGYIGGSAGTGGGNPPPPPIAGSAVLARTSVNPGTASSDGCSALQAGSLSGMIALIRRGTCSFFIKVQNAENAGAIGVVLYNNAAGIVSPAVSAPTYTPTIPVVSISSADGLAINNRLGTGPVTLSWTTLVTSLTNSTGGLISSFSSTGFSPDLSFKPDLGAPGGSIRSTFPIALGSYANLSGTSMSSPHVAGAVALLLEANPKIQANKVRDVLLNSAEPGKFATTLPFLDTVTRQGAGMLRIDRAIMGTTRITPSKLALGESQAGSSTQTLTVENRGIADVTYNLSSTNSLTVVPVNGLSLTPQQNAFLTSLTTDAAGVQFSSQSITVPAGGTGTVTATITAPAAAPQHALYGGWIVFTPQNDGEVVRVPYGGFVGDYQSIVALSDGGVGFPWLARPVGPNFNKQASGASFTLVNGDVPNILLHLDQQVSQLQIQVTDQSGRNWQFIDHEKYFARNSTPQGFFAFPFDGTTWTPNLKHQFTVPNGSYTITVRVLKALGNPDNPDDWETQVLPTLTIARP